MSGEQGMEGHVHDENSFTCHQHSGNGHKRLRAHYNFSYHAARIILGAIFLYASFDKILHPQAFAEAIYNYKILPDSMINLTALVLPWLEALLGACLLAGVWMPGASVISTGLLGIFIGALIFNQLRGVDIHCGCFSTESSGDPTGMLWTTLRDMLFLAFSIGLTLLVFFLEACPPATFGKTAIINVKKLKCCERHFR